MFDNVVRLLFKTSFEFLPKIIILGDIIKMIIEEINICIIYK